jgi:hypothetical protein
VTVELDKKLEPLSVKVWREAPSIAEEGETLNTLGTGFGEGDDIGTLAFSVAAVGENNCGSQKPKEYWRGYPLGRAKAVHGLSLGGKFWVLDLRAIYGPDKIVCQLNNFQRQ